MALRPLGADLFLWQDSCNVYVIRDGDRAMLIDLGDGSVLDALQQAGVAAVEWVLLTHHHREQCLGAGPLASHPLGRAAKLAAPEAERALFERPASFRTMKPTLNDAFTVYGSSYVRPPLMPVRIDRGFQKMDEFVWRGREFWCLDTRGNSGSSLGKCSAAKRWLMTALSRPVMPSSSVRSRPRCSGRPMVLK
jgi:glyoxylase-like metal-dependent hydrolase (beta-lactamase superfamily II)